MPENLYFRQPDTQRMLLDILYIFCKLNPDLSYRQGMHEILAPILWVVERDAIDLGESSKTLGEDALIKAMFDAEYVEHDAFALFGQVMQSAKNFYEQTTTSGRENPMVSRSKRIFSDMLPMVDNKLAAHLESIDIVPQVFLMRWIRLLFGREFTFDEMLTLWDVVFAEDATLEIVDHICLAMLLRIHWELVDADYNSALTVLLKYPEPGSSMPAQTFALDALYLRDHMDQHCGADLILKYTGKPVRNDGRPLTPPALQRNITTFSGAKLTGQPSAESSLSPPRSSFQPRNLEAVLQSTAKNIYARSEKLGIGKAVRSAVDEVHKKAQEIRDHQTPSPPIVRRSRGSRPSLSLEASQRRVNTLHDRSKQLSKLLEDAITELWEFQKVVAEKTDGVHETTDLADVEKLSVAIAKVQFVQVYLDDPDLPLPNDDENIQHDQKTSPDSNPVALNEQRGSTSHDPSSSARLKNREIPVESTDVISSRYDNSEAGAGDLADPSSFEDFEQPLDEDEKGAAESTPQLNVTTTDPVTSPTQSNPHNTSVARPRIEQSSFSWMLDKYSANEGSPMKSSSMSQNQARNRSYLFGDPSGDVSSDRRDSNVGTGVGKQMSAAGKDDRDESFDLNSLRHGKGKNG